MMNWCKVPIAYPIEGGTPVIEPTALQAFLLPHTDLIVAFWWFVWLSTILSVLFQYILIPLWKNRA